MSFRIAAKLDVKNNKLIKGVQMEGLRVVGNPWESATNYVASGIDEIIYSDAVASLYGHNQVGDVIEKTASELRVPFCVTGGIRTFEDAHSAFRRGADKVAINSGAIRKPELLRQIADVYGSQAVVLSIDAKSKGSSWEVYIDGGREKTGLNIRDWIRQAIDLGIGEILVNSVDRDGTFKGFDIDLVELVCAVSDRLPVIASGGCGSVNDILDLVKRVNIAGVAVASLLHVKKECVKDLRSSLKKSGVIVRDFL